ncbi:MAG: peptidylprolyl isomerase [Chloroflexi bacterium]|nr:peptidylprolyl isomerase [Chloroflexota bacterium]
MAKSRPTVAPPPTRKHLARVERERRQIRLIMAGTIAAVVLAAGLLGYGWLEQAVLAPRRPVARVGDSQISAREFQLAVKYQRLQLINQYAQLQQTMQFFGSDANTQAYFQNQLSQIGLQLNNTEALGREVLNNLIDDQLIRQEAERLGIAVSDAEIEARLQEMFGYFPNGTATPTITPPPPPPPPPPPSTPTAAATPTEGPSPTPTATGTPFPTATPYTADAYKTNQETTVQNLEQSIGMTLADLRRLVESLLYREKVLAAHTASVQREQDQVQVWDIVVADQEAAKQVKSRILAGEDFAALARQLSTDASSSGQGGYKGWVGLGQLTADLEKIVFNMNVGQFSNPVQDTLGWHIVKVTGHELRPISDAELEGLRTQEFDKWLETGRNGEAAKIDESWILHVPTEPALPETLQTGG